MTGPLYQTPLQTFIDFIKVIVAALLIAGCIRSFLIQPYYIPSGSMLETLQIGDRLFVTRFSYGLRIPFMDREIVSLGEPEHGDIIVFPAPKEPEIDYIKRVVGIPGDVIEIRDKQLYRNNQPVKEAYISHRDPRIVPVRDNMKPLTIPPGKLFVMGDNRDDSQDSRFWGMVDKDTVHGKAWVVYWSSVDFSNIRWDRIGNMLR